MRFGLSPDKSNLMRSSLPATYCSRSNSDNCPFCLLTVAVNCSRSRPSAVSLTPVSFCSCARSRKERLALEMASSDSARVSAASSLALSVALMSRLSAVSFCCNPARWASAAAFCLLRSVGLAPCAAPVQSSRARHNMAPARQAGRGRSAEGAMAVPRKKYNKVTWPSLGSPRQPGPLQSLPDRQVVMADRFQIGIEFIYQWLAVRNVQADDVVIADAVEHFDQGAQAIAVGRDDDFLAGANRRGNFVVPGWHHVRHGVFQAFGQRNRGFRQARVARIVERSAIIALFQRWRRRVVAAAPYQYLLVAILGCRLALVQALQGAVVTLVQAPVVLDRQIHHVHRVQRQPQGADRALQDRGVGHVKRETGFLEDLAGGPGFVDALFRQVDVGPASEAVIEVPGGLAVTHENDFIHSSIFSRGSNQKSKT